MKYDVIVIGGGQAGLAAGYYLKQTNKTFLILDAQERIGDAWRKRYDSLLLFTPRFYSSLPGKELQGDPDGYPTKDEIADYLEEYADSFSLPVQNRTMVRSVQQSADGFVITTNDMEYTAKQVVLATGAFQRAYIPDIADKLSPAVFQVHSSAYKNPTQLKEGTTLVVGAGNSGLQIAAEIAERKEVYVSVGKRMKFLPKTILGQSIFWWFDRLKISKVTIHSRLGQWMRRNDPIIGKEAKPLIKSGQIQLYQRIVAASGRAVEDQDGKRLHVDNVIWATGFRPDYSWLNIDGVLDAHGNPVHDRGVSPIPGLYFLGLSWQYKRGSALIHGVGEDAQYLSRKISNENS